MSHLIQVFQYLLEFMDIIDVSKLDRAFTNKTNREHFLFIIKEIAINYDYNLIASSGYKIYLKKSFYCYLSRRDIYLNFNNYCHIGYIEKFHIIDKLLSKSTNLTELSMHKRAIDFIPMILENNKKIKQVIILDIITDFGGIKDMLQRCKIDTLIITQKPILSFNKPCEYKIQCLTSTSIVFYIQTHILSEWQLIFDHCKNLKKLIIDCSSKIYDSYITSSIMLNLDFSKTQLTEITIKSQMNYLLIEKLFTTCQTIEKINYHLYSNMGSNNSYIHHVETLQQFGLESTQSVDDGILFVLVRKNL